ncbi:hypothetical protein [Saccharicrinis fermentans]|uniref:Uncharacterized protein n=1 Tax=Saccharicrinis fermentans DSM 9555 = JCM 21142 TaxID=869213 RepID=W7Y980_9BACT|nr:hypothetical protein [Saccharicrinis fermentans]GAF04872.1 hypothetical protein JCM21142_93594 [Saccharicrinis fermentans DSM 9555 = JCM 21142]
MTNKPLHTFHIPVMGTGYTIESPLKVAKYGIHSVIPLSDHHIMNQLIEIHSKENGLSFQLLDASDPKNRASIVCQYLNLVQDLVQEQFENLKKSPFEEGSEISKYFSLLPQNSSLKIRYDQMIEAEGDQKTKLQEELRSLMLPGSIDVNIMTKLDGVNFNKEGEAYSSEYNDAHSALKGFADSKLEASLILSAGMNPRLYGYMATFDDFYPNEEGWLRKKIVLKVSDYRSAMIQGRFLAKKGLWVSEFRIESGLNCGGHAFASDGYLLGPILKEFKDNREKLVDMLYAGYSDVLKKEKGIELQQALPIAYTVQGGVGDAQEHQMFIDYYGIESVGWGSPFLLVPEATTVDEFTQKVLQEGTEEDFYLSDISPLGVPFNSIRGNWADIEKQKRIDAGKPGAACLKQFLQFNTEFTKNPICTASVQYQRTKIEELKKTISNPVELKAKVEKLVEKACLCVGLGNTVLDFHKVPLSKGNHGVVVCPGPNLAYFNKISSLKEMIGHIYGKTSSLFNEDRPNVFIKELKIYMDYLKNKIEECKDDFTPPQVKYFNLFKNNLQDGISYYKEMFSMGDSCLKNMKEKVLTDLAAYKQELELMFVPQAVEKV